MISTLAWNIVYVAEKSGTNHNQQLLATDKPNH